MNVLVSSIDESRSRASSSKIELFKHESSSLDGVPTPSAVRRVPIVARLKACFRDVDPASTVSLVRDRVKCAQRLYNVDQRFYSDHGLHFARPSYFKNREWLSAIKVNTKNAQIRRQPAIGVFKSLALAVQGDSRRNHDWAAVDSIVKSCDTSYLSTAFSMAPIEELNDFLAKAILRYVDYENGFDTNFNFRETVEKLVACIDSPLLDRLIESSPHGHDGLRFLQVISCSLPVGVMNYFLDTVEPYLGNASAGVGEGSQARTLGERLLATMVRCAADPGAIGRLLEYGIFPNSKDENGQTILHGLAQNPWHNDARFDRTEAILDLLLRYGADINNVDNNGKTLLMLATMKTPEPIDGLCFGNYRYNDENRLVKALLEKGASTVIKDHEGRTAYWYAREHTWETQRNPNVDQAPGCGYSNVTHRRGHGVALQYLERHFSAEIEKADGYDFMPHHLGRVDPPLEFIRQSPNFEKSMPKYEQWKAGFPDSDNLARVLVNEDEQLDLGTKPISEPSSHSVSLGIVPVLLQSDVFCDHVKQFDDRFKLTD